MRLFGLLTISAGVLAAQAPLVFEPGVSAPLGSRGPVNARVIVEDFNRDGRPDAVFLNYQEIVVWLNRGGGSPPEIVTQPLATNALAMTVFDWNGDGRPDIAASTFLRPTGGRALSPVAIFQNRDAGNGRILLNTYTFIDLGWDDLGTIGLQSGDFNRDGRTDLLQIGAVNGMWSGLSQGTFFAPGVYTRLTFGGIPRDTAMGDFNGDGIPDLAVSGDGRAMIFNGRSDGRMTEGQLLQYPRDMRLVRVADVNGDRRPDLLVAAENQVNVYLGQGSGTFSGPETIAMPGTITDLLAADMDNDGALDIVTAHGQLSITRRDPVSGRWQAPAVLPNVTASVFAVGDFDGDRRMDILARSVSGGDGRLYRQIQGALTSLEVRPVGAVVYGEMADLEARLIAQSNLPAVYDAGSVTGTVWDGQQDVPLADIPLRTVNPALPLTTVNALPALVATGRFRVQARSTNGISLALSYGGGNGLARISETYIGVPVERRTPRIRFALAAPPRTYEVVVDGGDRRDLALATGLVHADSRGRRLVSVPLTDGRLQMTLPPEAAEVVLSYEGDRNYQPASIPLGAAQSTEARTINAASGALALAPNSIASLFAASVAPRVTAASELPLPFELEGVRVYVRDIIGAEHPAPLFFVSPGQVNLLVPERVAAGPAVIDVRINGELARRAVATVDPVAPGIFTVNGAGTGAPAAVATRVAADGTRTEEPVFRCTANGCEVAPIRLTGAAAVVLTVYGTGLRFGELPTAAARLGDARLPLLYVGAQGGAPGLDQVNFEIPVNLAGRGDVDLVLEFAGVRSNPVRLRLE